MDIILKGTFIAIIIVFLFISFPTIMSYILLGVGLTAFLFLVYNSILIIFDWA